MKNWITSDLHFFHRKIAKFCPKTRSKWAIEVNGEIETNIEAMNSDMIAEWNSKVSRSDRVYILGDVSFGSAKETVAILQQLAGAKFLIKGNHDQHNMQDAGFRNCFEKIYDYYEAKFNGHHCVMFHFPISEWHKCHRGAVHLHGHLHGSVSGLEKYRVRDVGFDATGNVVSLLEDIIESAATGEIRGHHNV